ncbi:hypothetical protein AC630_06230 [Bradyrhizobium sp. AS23.2]|nr:hypothetical protein AC630_06230 [Bradyrhizobium sp. AS23.2]
MARGDFPRRRCKVILQSIVVASPLTGHQVVNATDPAEHIITMLRGLSGKAINGQEYKVEMPPFADSLISRSPISSITSALHGATTGRW